jgi:hypothetical protein
MRFSDAVEIEVVAALTDEQIQGFPGAGKPVTDA